MTGGYAYTVNIIFVFFFAEASFIVSPSLGILPHPLKEIHGSYVIFLDQKQQFYCNIDQKNGKDKLPSTNRQQNTVNRA